MSAKKKPVRRRPPRPPVGTAGSLHGVPIYDGAIVAPDLGLNDSRVLLGIGPADGLPVAYVSLCPCDGVTGLVADLVAAGDAARPGHLAHGGRLDG